MSFDYLICCIFGAAHVGSNARRFIKTCTLPISAC